VLSAPVFATIDAVVYFVKMSLGKKAA